MYLKLFWELVSKKFQTQTVFHPGQQIKTLKNSLENRGLSIQEI